MNTFQLQCFISVESHLSFTKAAEDRHVVQATISRQILTLEEELGVKLFERDSHGVRTTPAGDMLAHYAPVFLEYQKTISERVRNASTSFDLSIRIGVGPYEHLLLREPLVALHRSFPDIGIDLTTYTYYVLMTRYRNKVLDMALCNELCAAQMADFTPLEVCCGNWKVAAAKNNRLWTLPGTCQTLSGQNIITLVNDQFDSVRKYCYETLESPRMIETNFLSTQLEMVNANLGVAILPPFVEPYLPDNVRMLDVLEVPFAQKFFAMISPKLAGTYAEILMDLWRMRDVADTFSEKCVRIKADGDGI